MLMLWSLCPTQPQEKLLRPGTQDGWVVDAQECGTRQERAGGVEGIRACELCSWIHLGGKFERCR